MTVGTDNLDFSLYAGRKRPGTFLAGMKKTQPRKVWQLQRTRLRVGAYARDVTQGVCPRVTKRFCVGSCTDTE